MKRSPKIFTEEMGQPPMDPEGGSVRPSKPVVPDMSQYKPRRPKTKAEDAISSEQKKQMLQSIQDEKDRQRIKGMGFASGGKVSSASKRADGCVQRGKTRGVMV
jgi:hypothetical protein